MMSERERETICLRKWKKAAKGRPMRWRILRDVVAVLSLEWMSTFQVQIAMRRLWALKNKTTRDILEELEAGRSVGQVKDEETQSFMWASTLTGVAFWIGDVDSIPVSIVKVAVTSASVNE
ncbi:unnamed protein product [marine sediment metagenome]|uniref:Uncharacterized protein n=1 Tax=marine sediment metagenome TaxID=412755 RepID=X1K1I5_9ZZZZ